MVIEVGAGLGVLTRALAGVSVVRARFEIETLGPAGAGCGQRRADPRPALRDSCPGTTPAALAGPAWSFTSRTSCALRSRLSLRAPTLCASNLPYSVAAPFLAEAMTRLAAGPALLRDGAARDRRPSGGHCRAPRRTAPCPSWVQLHTRLVDVRPLSRAIFYPRPRVDSSLLTLDRRPGDRRPSAGGIPSLVLSDPVLVRRVIDGAFGQRRKTAVNALQAASGLPKETLAAALVEVGASAGARAEQLAPEQFAALAERLAQDWPR